MSRFDPGALFDPGEAEDFFAAAALAGPFDPSSPAFSPSAAWWLAELSRLVYRREHDEGVTRAQAPTRGEVLARFGLRERLFFSETASCQGFVVESCDPRAPWSALVFRGTKAPGDWLTNGQAFLGEWDPGGLVHVGFRDALLAEWPRIASALNGAPGPVFYAGHSLGGALATLATSLRPPSALYTFGAPRVGTSAFWETLRAPCYRVVNNRDAVTEVPLPFPNLGFAHGGELHYFDHQGRATRQPNVAQLAWDRLRWEPDQGRAFTDLPKFMTDHAPINYSALLARQLKS